MQFKIFSIYLIVQVLLFSCNKEYHCGDIKMSKLILGVWAVISDGYDYKSLTFESKNCAVHTMLAKGPGHSGIYKFNGIKLKLFFENGEFVEEYQVNSNPLIRECD